MIEPTAIPDLTCVVDFQGAVTVPCFLVTTEQNGLRGIAFFFDVKGGAIYFFGRDDIGPTMSVTDMAIGDGQPTPVRGGECAVTRERVSCRATFRNGEIISVVAR